MPDAARDAEFCEADGGELKSSRGSTISPAADLRASRGALTGIILGAAIWLAILAAVVSLRN